MMADCGAHDSKWQRRRRRTRRAERQLAAALNSHTHATRTAHTRADQRDTAQEPARLQTSARDTRTKRSSGDCGRARTLAWLSAACMAALVWPTSCSSFAQRGFSVQGKLCLPQLLPHPKSERLCVEHTSQLVTAEARARAQHRCAA